MILDVEEIAMQHVAFRSLSIEAQDALLAELDEDRLDGQSEDIDPEDPEMAAVSASAWMQGWAEHVAGAN